MEESLSLPELEAILAASREKEHREQKFMAALKGINLDEGKEKEGEAVLSNIEARAKARISGRTEEEVNRLVDAEAFGLEFEVEE